MELFAYPYPLKGHLDSGCKKSVIKKKFEHEAKLKVGVKLNLLNFICWYECS